MRSSGAVIAGIRATAPVLISARRPAGDGTTTSTGRAGSRRSTD